MKRTSTAKRIPVPNLAELLKPYVSGWVALSADERAVVAAGATLRETRSEAERHGVSEPVFVKVIPPDEGYLPASV